MEEKKEKLEFAGENQRRSFVEILKRRSCVRCALRIIGFKEVYLYRLTSYKDILSPFLKDMGSLAYDAGGHIFTPEGTVGPQVCQLCMGILQYCDACPLGNRLAEVLKNTQHQRSDYKLKVKFPRYLTLTQYHVVYEISLAFPSLFNYLHRLDKQMIPGKDIFKWIMAPLINKGSGLSVNLKGEFFLCVAFEYPPEIELVGVCFHG